VAPLGPSVTLTLEHASRLWETFHTGALVAEERESCLNWFEDARSYTRKGFVAFSDEVAHLPPRPYPPPWSPGGGGGGKAFAGVRVFFIGPTGSYRAEVRRPGKLAFARRTHQRLRSLFLQVGPHSFARHDIPALSVSALFR